MILEPETPMKNIECVLFPSGRPKLLVDSPRVLWPVNGEKIDIVLGHFTCCPEFIHPLQDEDLWIFISRPYIFLKPQSCVPNLDFSGCFSVVQSCLTLCSLMDCSAPGFHVLCYLPELQFIVILMSLLFDSIYPKPNPLSPPETWILFPSYRSSQAG